MRSTSSAPSLTGFPATRQTGESLTYLLTYLLTSYVLTYLLTYYLLTYLLTYSRWASRAVTRIAPELATASAALLELDRTVLDHDATLLAATALATAATTPSEEGGQEHGQGPGRGGESNSAAGSGSGSQAASQPRSGGSGFLHLIVANLAQYKHMVARVVADAPDAALADVWSAAFSGALSHRAEVEQRLHFISFACVTSPLLLELPLIASLHEELVTNAACVEEVCHVLTFLRSWSTALGIPSTAYFLTYHISTD